MNAVALLWLAGPAIVAGAHFATEEAAAWVRMAVIVVALFAWAKAIVLAAAARRGTRLGAADRLEFAVLWPGMRPRSFAGRAPRALPGAGEVLRRGLARIAAGAACIAIAHGIVAAGGSRALATAPLLAGMSLILHFGVFRLAAALGRARGRDLREPFRDPLRAPSLGEFWSHRWNAAFSELVQETVIPPLRRAGPAVATFASFILSGLLHEAAITLPVRTGGGGPTLYFAIQGAAVLAERRLGPFGAPGTLLCVALPLPLLCPPAFIRDVVWPIAGF